MDEERMAREERAERVIKDVIASLKMGNKAVTEVCLAWLIDKGEVGREWTVANLAETVLYLIAVDQRSDGDAANVVEILEELDELSSERKPQKSHTNFLEIRKVEFCFCNGSHGPRLASSWIDRESGGRHDRVLETMEESEAWVKKWLRDVQNRHFFLMSCDETSLQSKDQSSSANERSSRSEVRCHASTIHRSTPTRHARHSLLLF
jgi:hypothetical protein